MSVFLCMYYWANNFVSWFFTYIPATFCPDISCFSQKLCLITIYCFNSTRTEISQQPSFFLETLKIIFLLHIILKWILLCVRLFLIQIIYWDTFIIVDSYMKQHEYFWDTWYVFPNYFVNRLVLFTYIQQ